MVAEEDDECVLLLSTGFEAGEGLADEVVGLPDAGEVFRPVLAHDRSVGEESGQLHRGGIDADLALVAVRVGSVGVGDVVEQEPRLAGLGGAGEEGIHRRAAGVGEEFVVRELLVR